MKKIEKNILGKKKPMINTKEESEIANLIAKMANKDTTDLGVSLGRLHKATCAILGWHVVNVQRNRQLEFLNVIEKTMKDNDPIETIRVKLHDLNQMKEKLVHGYNQ